MRIEIPTHFALAEDIGSPHDPAPAKDAAPAGSPASGIGGAGAEAHAAALAASGFYVSIARQAKTAPVVPPGAKYSILSIDDDPELLDILKHELDIEGYDVRTASDRGAIIAELRKEDPPSLILLDVGLPGMNGLDILLKLRRHERLGRIPIILLTGHGNHEYILRGLALGADGYITKPFKFETLAAAIRTVLGIR